MDRFEWAPTKIKNNTERIAPIRMIILLQMEKNYLNGENEHKTPADIWVK